MVTPDANGAGEQVEILPLTVVARSFPARPSSLPDVRDFVRHQLTGSRVTDDDIRRLCDRVAEVLLDAAGVSGSIQVSLRIFPESSEVDVLVTAEGAAPPAPRRPAVAHPAVAGPAVVHPAVVHPAATHPAATHPAATHPAVVHPAVNGPSVPERPAPPERPDTTARPDTADGPPLSFAAWFAARLRREGLTMEAAARRLDVSAKTISRWVAGTTEPRLRDLLRIREIFGEPPIH